MRLVAFALLAVACQSSSNPDGGNPGQDGDVPAECTGEAPSGTAGMIAIPTTTFEMGCEDGLPGTLICDGESKPAHQVTVCAYEIDVTEVTMAEYDACMDDGACTLPTGFFDPINFGGHPVTWVEWNQADDYCRWAGKRLPTEAEWELAARGTDGRVFPWGNDPVDCTLANWSECSDESVAAAENTAGASPYGALNMIGNVAEWVNDWHDVGYYAQSPEVDPQGPATGIARVFRGGSYAGPGDEALHAMYRDNDPEDGSRDDKGFRCAK